MREFMTKVSDYISERRNDPEKNGNLFVFDLIGVAILVIVILCLLLLWRKNTAVKDQEMKAETFTETAETIMAEAPEKEELRQQYLSNIEYLGERVAELMESMTEVKETLEEAVTAEREDNAELVKQIRDITEDIGRLILRLDNTQNQLYDLTDIVNVMNTDTIPAIQAQITEIEEQMAQAGTDISDIYSKIDALETTDEELQARIEKIEGSLKDSVEQNIANITNQFADMSTHIKQIEEQVGDSQTQIKDIRQQINDMQNTIQMQINDMQNTMQTQIDDMRTQINSMQERIQDLSLNCLRYRYDAETNTLYLTK